MNRCFLKTQLFVTALRIFRIPELEAKQFFTQFLGWLAVWCVHLHIIPYYALFPLFQRFPWMWSLTLLLTSSLGSSSPLISQCTVTQSIVTLFVLLRLFNVSLHSSTRHDYLRCDKCFDCSWAIGADKDKEMSS